METIQAANHAVPKKAQAHHAAPGTPQSIRKVLTGVTLGNTVEWFDYALYASMVLIIGDVFFPGENRTAQLMATYGTLAVGFVMRPLGGMVFGPIGDRYGRRAALTMSILLMAGCTFCIAAIPSYDSIGIMAPILLIGLRLLQGLSIGGEYAGSVIFIGEYAPPRCRSFLTSWLEVSILSGFLLGGIVVNMLLWGLGEENMRAFGWRIPFVIGGLLGLVALWLRLNLEETPVFQQAQQQIKASAQPPTALWPLLFKEWRSFLQALGLVAVFNIAYYVVVAYIPGYLSNEMGHSIQFSNTVNLVATFCLVATIPLFGWMADRFGCKRLFIIGCVLIFILAVPAFKMMQSRSVPLIYAGQLVLLFATLFFYGGIGAILAALFSTRVRYSALAISAGLAVATFGGTAPLINTWLIDRFGDPIIPAYYLMTGAVVGLIAILTAEDLTGKPLKSN